MYWKYILLAAASLIVISDLFLIIRGSGVITPDVDKGIYICRDVIPLGISFLSLFGIKRPATGGIRENLYVSYFEKDKSSRAMYYASAHAIGAALLFIPAGLFISVIASSPLFILLTAGAVILAALYPDEEIRKRLSERKKAMLLSLPEVLARLSLLTGAGMMLREAWKRTADSADGPLFDEMKRMSAEIDNGVSENQALHNFSRRCSVKEISHFASVISQNLSGGGFSIASCLKYMNEESWEERKNRAKIQGLTASQKLMIPLIMMFAGILAMIIIPLFAGI